MVTLRAQHPIPRRRRSALLRRARTRRSADLPHHPRTPTSTSGPASLTSLVVAALATLAVLVAGPLAAGAQTSEEERDDVRRRQSRLADELDVLEASDRDVDRALTELESAIDAQALAVDAADEAVDDARAAVRKAEADLRRARRDVETLRSAVAEMAVASFVHQPLTDRATGLSADTLSDALIGQMYLDARAKRDLDLLDLYEEAQRVAEERVDAVVAATAAAEAAAADAAVELTALQTEQAERLDFAIALQDRIDRALAESAALADLDAELSARIAAEQAALIDRLPEPPPIPVVSAPQPVDDGEIAAPELPATTLPATTLPATTLPATTVPEIVDPAPATTAPTTTAPPTTTPPSTNPPPTTPPPTTPPPTATPPLRTVQGITVHADIADAVDAMLTAARADGISLSGSGYRSTARQIELRRAHCGPTYYDIWVKRASACRPPTAIPGRSLHEQGKALDLLYNGRLITSRSNDGFRWLAANAATYGLYNLPSEPWHWSVSGG